MAHCFKKIFFYSLLLLLSDTMERQNLMMSPSKFLFKKEKSQNWFACLELFKLAAAVLLLQFKTSFEFLSKCYHVLWVPKQSPWENGRRRDLNQQSFACQFNILMILEYSTSGKFTFMTWQKVKTKKEESLQARWCYSRNRMRSQRVSSGKGIFSVFSACWG